MEKHKLKSVTELYIQLIKLLDNHPEAAKITVAFIAHTLWRLSEVDGKSPTAQDEAKTIALNGFAGYITWINDNLHNQQKGDANVPGHQ